MGVVVPLRGLDAQSSREGMSSSGGEDEEEAEQPWSARELELLDALVRNFGELLFFVPYCCTVYTVRQI